LRVGDIGGALTIAALGGLGPANTTATYIYTVENTGNVNATVTSISDDKLGEILTGPIELPAGEETSVRTDGVLTNETTVNVATVKGESSPGGTQCISEGASNEVTVTIVKLSKGSKGMRRARRNRR
jgi:hypothetical protein